MPVIIYQYIKNNIKIKKVESEKEKFNRNKKLDAEANTYLIQSKYLDSVGSSAHVMPIQRAKKILKRPNKPLIMINKGCKKPLAVKKIRWNEDHKSDIDEDDDSQLPPIDRKLSYRLKKMSITEESPLGFFTPSPAATPLISNAKRLSNPPYMSRISSDQSDSPYEVCLNYNSIRKLIIENT